MFRIDRLVVSVMLVGVAAVVWGAVKIPSFVLEESRLGCALPGDPIPVIPITLDADADGMAILNYVAGQDKTVVQVIVSDFKGDPTLNGRYFVRLNPGSGFDIGTFQVGPQGNGHFHGEVSGDQSGSNVELWAQPGPCSKVLIARGG